MLTVDVGRGWPREDRSDLVGGKIKMKEQGAVEDFILAAGVSELDRLSISPNPVQGRGRE